MSRLPTLRVFTPWPLGWPHNEAILAHLDGRWSGHLGSTAAVRRVLDDGVRALGLDVGSKTIGVAVSDTLGVAAHPHVTLPRKGTAADVAAVLAIFAAVEAEAMVVGMPFELSGREGPRARRVRVLIDALRAALPAGVELHEQDERFTTAEAERVLIAGNVSRERRREVIDQQAAALILQGWLDARRRTV